MEQAGQKGRNFFLLCVFGFQYAHLGETLQNLRSMRGCIDLPSQVIAGLMSTHVVTVMPVFAGADIDDPALKHDKRRLALGPLELL